MLYRGDRPQGRSRATGYTEETGPREGAGPRVIQRRQAPGKEQGHVLYRGDGPQGRSRATCLTRQRKVFRLKKVKAGFVTRKLLSFYYSSFSRVLEHTGLQS